MVFYYYKIGLVGLVFCGLVCLVVGFEFGRFDCLILIFGWACVFVEFYVFGVWVLGVLV